MEQTETTDQERRERVTRNLESIQDCLNSRRKVRSEMTDLEGEYDVFTRRLDALRDQVLKDLTVLDSALTSR